MRLTSELGVDAPVERTWAALLEADPPDGAWRGILNGYAGSVHLDDVDEDERAAGFYAQGRELRGDGLASARVTARLAGDAAGTRVLVETDLHLAGRAAELEPSALQEATDTLLGRLVAQLEQTLTAPAPEPPAPAPEPVAPAPEAAAGAPEPRVPVPEPSVPPAEPSVPPGPLAAERPSTEPVATAADGRPSPAVLAGRASRKLDLLVAADKVAERALLLVVGGVLGLLLGRTIWGRR